jgi:alpha-glucosidase
VLATGNEQTLLTDDTNRIFAFQRSDAKSLAVVVINAGAPGKATTSTLHLSHVPNGTRFIDAATHAQLTITNGQLVVPVDGESGRVLLRA